LVLLIADGGGVLTADAVVLDGVRVGFVDEAVGFAGACDPLGLAHDGVVLAAGQFVGDIRPGAAAFLLSWRAVLGACERDARLIAGNIHKNVVDLSVVDSHLAGRLRL
jgi:hypothetical protein